jgi:hemerythrin-like domain-containing protein
MRSTDILQNEHRVIEQVLSCLEKMSEQALVAGKLDELSARQALDFLQTFADRCHHGKEENYLFPLMEAKGFPREGGPTGVMLHEHEVGREHIRGMEAALPDAAACDKAGLRHFALHADAYVALLRQHIFKEDHRLFPMASQVCSAKDDADLVDCFARIELHDMEEGVHEHYLGVARDLANRFQVPQTAVAVDGCGHRAH